MPDTVNMGEDECDLFSEKLEDIHLARHSSLLANTQLPAGFVQKRSDIPATPGGQDFTPWGVSKYWQDVLEDIQPVLPQDIILPNLVSDESVDFSRDFTYFKPDVEALDLNSTPVTCSPDVLFDLSAGSTAIIPPVCESPVPFNRSRPASPNPKELNGSEKKRVKYEKADDLPSPPNGLVFFENGDGRARKISNGQAVIIPVTYFNALTCQANVESTISAARYVSSNQPLQAVTIPPILTPERRLSNPSAIQSTSSIQIQLPAASIPSNQAVGAIYSNQAASIPFNQAVGAIYSNQAASIPSNQTIYSSQSLGGIYNILSPDSTEQQFIIPTGRTPSEKSYSHSRSVSTSPELRDDYMMDRRETGKGKEKGSKLPRHKRPSHINAEQRRRSKIQSGIEELNALLAEEGDPKIVVGTSKKSNAALLGKAAYHCRDIKGQLKVGEAEATFLRSEIEALTAEINEYHTQLPADGVSQTKVVNSVSVEQMFYSYVRNRIQSNWKFYIFGLLIRPFFESYNRLVSTTSISDFMTTVAEWSQNHFTLGAFRQNTTPIFRHISKKTSFMLTPEKLPQEALALSANIGRSHIDSSGNTVSTEPSTHAPFSGSSTSKPDPHPSSSSSKKYSPSRKSHSDR